MASVMIADDAAFLRLMLRGILEKAGHRVVTEAANGLEAIEKFKAFRPDLVVLDVNMPEMDGIEALRHIRRADPLAKVIMCSALGQKHLIVDAFRYGAADYILKPFHPQRIHEAIHRVYHASAAE